MKVKDFIKQEISVDVVDDVCEELYIAFDGPLHLTDAGKEHFAYALELEVEMHSPCPGDILAIVHVDDEFFHDEMWEYNLEKATEFFWAAAGYCAEDDYKKWFDDYEKWFKDEEVIT